MKEQVTDKELESWFSTYGILTAKRILTLFKIDLNNEELTKAIKNPASVYYQLLQVPLKNIFNGIILQQVHDYQVYIQKLFVDYLLSGESEKSEDAPGAQIREDIKAEHEKLLQLNTKINDIELDHQQFIAESQQKLIEWTCDVKEKLQSASIKTILDDLHLQEMFEIASALSIKTRGLRSEVYDLILRSLELFSLLPDYKIDPIKNEKNQSFILFDLKIGEKD